MMMPTSISMMKMMPSKEENITTIKWLSMMVPQQPTKEMTKMMNPRATRKAAVDRLCWEKVICKIQPPATSRRPETCFK